MNNKLSFNFFTYICIFILLSTLVFFINHIDNSLLQLDEIIDGQHVKTWDDSLTFSGSVLSLASLRINDHKIDHDKEFSSVVPLRKGKNVIKIDASFLILHKTITFTATKMEDIDLNLPKFTDSPKVRITGTLNPDYTLITDKGTFKANSEGQILVDLIMDNREFKNSPYTVNFKVLDQHSTIVFSDIVKIFIDRQAFINTLIKKSSDYFSTNYPELSFVACDYNIINYDGTYWGLVSFNTNDKIDSTEMICSWGKNGWEKAAFGTVMETRDQLTSSDVFKRLYNISAWKKLISPKVELAILQKYAKERDSLKEEMEKKQQLKNGVSEVSLSELDKEYLKYVGGALKFKGHVYQINERYLTTDALITDGKAYIHVRLYKRTNLKKGDKVVVYGEIQGEENSHFIKGSPSSLISILAKEINMQ